MDKSHQYADRRAEIVKQLLFHDSDYSSNIDFYQNGLTKLWGLICKADNAAFSQKGSDYDKGLQTLDELEVELTIYLLKVKHD